jgi:hypothetical protein
MPVHQRSSRSRGNHQLAYARDEDSDRGVGRGSRSASRYNDEYEPISRSYIEQRNY